MPVAARIKMQGISQDLQKSFHYSIFTFLVVWYRLLEKPLYQARVPVILWLFVGYSKLYRQGINSEGIRGVGNGRLMIKLKLFMPLQMEVLQHWLLADVHVVACSSLNWTSQWQLVHLVLICCSLHSSYSEAAINWIKGKDTVEYNISFDWDDYAFILDLLNYHKSDDERQ